MTRRVAGGVTGVVTRSKSRCRSHCLGDQALSLSTVAVEIKELFQAIDRRLSAALNRADNSLGEVLNLVDSTTELLHRSGGAQDIKG